MNSIIAPAFLQSRPRHPHGRISAVLGRNGVADDVLRASWAVVLGGGRVHFGSTAQPGRTSRGG